MCKHCIKKSHPDRDDCCLDTGHYLLNHNACHQCGVRGQLRVDNKVITIENEDDEVEEKTTYDHVCDNCNHKAASHFYQFSVSIENGVHVQNFIMACALCGKGGDHRKLANEAEETKLVSPPPASTASFTGETFTTPQTVSIVNSSLLGRVAQQLTKQDDEDDEDEDDWT